MIIRNQRLLYSFGVVLANIKLEPFDENAEVSLDSLLIIMGELDISEHNHSVLEGFANSRDISIEEAKSQINTITDLIAPSE